MGIGYWIGASENSNEEPRVLVQVGAQIGQGTNNEAEWQALLATMRHALRLGFWNLSVKTDSLMVFNQLNYAWKAKGRLKLLRDEAQNLRRLFTEFDIRHVYREQNKAADYLSHQLHFEELTLPSPPVAVGSRKQKHLLSWQAAAIRIWSLRNHPGSGTLSRVFGLASSAIEAIAEGRAYRTADFSEYPAWMSFIRPHPAETNASLPLPPL